MRTDLGATMCAMLDAGIPAHMRDSLLAYIYDGRPGGDFLMAVLSNDLEEAVARADDANLCLIVHYVRFLYNHAPRACWGSVEAVARWLDVGGLNGIMTLFEVHTMGTNGGRDGNRSE